MMSRKMVVARWATGRETGQERGGGGRRVLAGEKEASRQDSRAGSKRPNDGTGSDQRRFPLDAA